MRFAEQLSRYGIEVVMDKLHDDNGYINLLREVETVQGSRPAYLSISLLRQAAARIPQVGLSPTTDLELAREHVENAEAMIAQLQDELARLEAKLDNINGLVKHDFKIVRQQGRPPKKVAANA
jgi:outer membrane protein TolC